MILLCNKQHHTFTLALHCLCDTQSLCMSSQIPRFSVCADSLFQTREKLLRQKSNMLKIIVPLVNSVQNFFCKCSTLGTIARLQGLDDLYLVGLRSYAWNCSRLCKILTMVLCGTPSSVEALRVDFVGLSSKEVRTASTVSSLDVGQLVCPFC